MKRIYDIHKIVLGLLEEDPETRSNEWYLFKRTCQQANAEALNLTLGKALIEANELRLPKFESVTRTRRMIVKDRPDLKGKREVENGREEAERIVRRYAVEVSQQADRNEGRKI